MGLKIGYGSILMVTRNDIPAHANSERPEQRWSTDMWPLSIALISLIALYPNLTWAEPKRFAMDGSRLTYDAAIPFPSRTTSGIEKGDESELLYYLEHNPDLHTVVLTADGGSMDVAADMADVIESHDADTEVKGHCYSACTLIFLGGKHRILPKGSLLGFHRSYIRVPDIPSDDGKLTTEDVVNTYDQGEDAALRDMVFMRDHDVDIRFTLKVLTYERGNMWIPSREVLTAAGVLTEP